MIFFFIFLIHAFFLFSLSLSFSLSPLFLVLFFTVVFPYVRILRNPRSFIYFSLRLFSSNRSCAVHISCELRYMSSVWNGMRYCILFEELTYAGISYDFARIPLDKSRVQKKRETEESRTIRKKMVAFKLLQWRKFPKIIHVTVRNWSNNILQELVWQ